jgi:bifunctional non-homologous end joining protein LigD
MNAVRRRTTPSPATQVTKASTRAARNRVVADADVTITHPDRLVFAKLQVSKRDVADYYRSVADWMLPELRDRPLSVLRCPGGTARACFFQKHLAGTLGAHVRGVRIKDSSGYQDYLAIDDTAGLIELVQMNTIEFHPWGVRSAQPGRADRIVFDLDPHAGVAWNQVVAGANAVHRHLESVGLAAYLRTSGGKGLHVVVPLRPALPWKTVRPFAKAVATALAVLHPDLFVAVAGEKKRVGRIFIDWLRNSRGATSIASYSLRARADAGVAMPLAWNRLAKLGGAHAFDVGNALAHIRRRSVDPWQGIDSVEQALPRIAK